MTLPLRAHGSGAGGRRQRTGSCEPSLKSGCGGTLALAQCHAQWTTGVKGLVARCGGADHTQPAQPRPHCHRRGCRPGIVWVSVRKMIRVWVSVPPATTVTVVVRPTRLMKHSVGMVRALANMLSTAASVTAQVWCEPPAIP